MQKRIAVIVLRLGSQLFGAQTECTFNIEVDEVVDRVETAPETILGDNMAKFSDTSDDVLNVLDFVEGFCEFLLWRTELYMSVNDPYHIVSCVGYARERLDIPPEKKLSSHVESIAEE